ncbi:MAG: NAD(P)H-dependent oxidoreductase subunit E [Chitinivibrionales bacterium]|nr:NAD(P)H-dependent oxidoreductase subunit E [Chitinivibrionales bacterium]
MTAACAGSMVEKSTGLPAAVRAYAEECLSRPHPRSYLIPVLHRLQKEERYLKREHLAEVARLFDITEADVLGVATFYHYFTLVPRGEHEVSVCLGTACHVKGAGAVLKRIKELLGIADGETTPDGRFSITSARCVGMCALAPVVIVGKRVYGNVTVADVEGILREHGFEGAK